MRLLQHPTRDNPEKGLQHPRVVRPESRSACRRPHRMNGVTSGLVRDSTSGMLRIHFSWLGGGAAVGRLTHRHTEYQVQRMCALGAPRVWKHSQKKLSDRAHELDVIRTRLAAEQQAIAGYTPLFITTIDRACEQSDASSTKSTPWIPTRKSIFVACDSGLKWMWMWMVDGQMHFLRP